MKLRYEIPVIVTIYMEKEDIISTSNEGEWDIHDDATNV